MKSGRSLVIFSVVTRFGVVLLLLHFAMWTHYINYKVSYNNPRLVELSAGKTMRLFYEYSDNLFSLFGDPVEVMQTNGGMTWSIRVFGLPFTDPIAALSVLVKNHNWEFGFFLGLVIPVCLALLFGRVFCTYICPASLIFFSINRLRRLLSNLFYFPNVQLPRGVAWGLLCGGLLTAFLYGHGIWTLILPYFAVGQTIFHSIAFGTLSIAVASLILFSMADLFFGKQFTCRNLCPTGRLLGFLGSRAFVTIQRNADDCIDKCTLCNEICPLDVKPKFAKINDCSLCGECMIVCPTKCLSIGNRTAS